MRKNAVPDDNEWGLWTMLKILDCSISKLSDKSLLGETRLVKDKYGKKAGEDVYGPINRLLK